MKQRIKEKVNEINNISKPHNLTIEGENIFNYLDQDIINIMINVEGKIVSISKHILSQLKSRISYHSQIEYQTKSLETSIDTHCINICDIKRKLRNTNRNLKKIRSKANNLRTKDLFQRALAINLETKNHSSKTIIII